MNDADAFKIWNYSPKATILKNTSVHVVPWSIEIEVSKIKMEMVQITKAC